MNRFCISLIVVLLSAVMLAAGGDVFGDVNPDQIPAMLNNEAFVEAQHKCLMVSEEEVASKCDRIGKKLRTNLIDSIKKGDCSTTCTDNEKQIIVNVIVTVQKKYPQVWKDMITQFHITDDEQKKCAQFVKEVQAKFPPKA